jgi:hypothetical protein
MRKTNSASVGLIRAERRDRRGFEKARLRALRMAQSAELASIWSHPVGKNLPTEGKSHATGATPETSTIAMILIS